MCLLMSVRLCGECSRSRTQVHGLVWTCMNSNRQQFSTKCECELSHKIQGNRFTDNCVDYVSIKASSHVEAFCIFQCNLAQRRHTMMIYIIDENGGFGNGVSAWNWFTMYLQSMQSLCESGEKEQHEGTQLDRFRIEHTCRRSSSSQNVPSEKCVNKNTARGV